jgi:molybdenum cofactor biosynthesis enzyme MoaA
LFISRQPTVPVPDALGKKVGWILLMGGEPLLHPELERFFPAARTAFPSAKIKIVTNGILLSKKEDSFWRHSKKDIKEWSL